MPHRLVLFDALRSLNQGHAVVEYPADPCPSFGRHLEGVPEIHVVIGWLKREGWVREIEAPGPMRHWVITEAGRAEFRRGQDWYHSLAWWQMLLGRIGFPYSRGPSCAPDGAAEVPAATGRVAGGGMTED